MGRSRARACFQPLPGQLVSLKTKHEVQTLIDTTDAFVVALPKRFASRAASVLKTIQSKPPGQPSFTHLRKFVNTENLPRHLQDNFKENHAAVPLAEDVVHFLIPPPFPSDPATILATFRNHVDPDFPLELRQLTIPLYPPVSQEQARQNTEKYWPGSFNPAAQSMQHVPPYNTLRSLTATLVQSKWHVGHYMKLARLAADQSCGQGLGRRVGAVVVDGTTGLIVAVAGDARWMDDPNGRVENEGRPEKHALMRVIAMVAAKERESRKLAEDHPTCGMEVAATPLTPIEKMYYATDDENARLPPGYPPSRHSLPAENTTDQLGYLCANLDVYITHEPCVMCSMGMVHSRFRACILGQRMDGTGGLCAEMNHGGIGYGLGWRRELNWRVMAFEYKSKTMHADHIFHA